MRSLALLRATVVTVVTTATHAAPAADLTWLSGDWRRCKDGEIVEERWLGPRADLMIGANLTTSSAGKASFENLRIVRADDGWTYWASPMGRPPVPFKLVESAAQRAVFANPEHGFPARVVYWREGEDLLARIEGTLRDKPAALEWRFTRGTAEDCPKAP
jgi:Domain of unknown function (DUF6265)